MEVIVVAGDFEGATEPAFRIHPFESLNPLGGRCPACVLGGFEVVEAAQDRLHENVDHPDGSDAPDAGEPPRVVGSDR